MHTRARWTNCFLGDEEIFLHIISSAYVLIMLYTEPHTGWGQTNIFSCLVLFNLGKISVLSVFSFWYYLYVVFLFPFRWFTYMGEAEGNPFVPFQITYIETNKTIDKYVPLNLPITPCSKGISVSLEVIHFDSLKYLSQQQ